MRRELDVRRTLLLVRHGETSWNREGRYQGHTDVPLSEAGREQARRLRHRLADERHLWDAERTAVLSSDLARARETAELAFGAPGRTISVDAGLREIRFGVFEGLTRDEIDERHPGRMAAWIHGAPDLAVPGGESRREARARALAALETFLERAPHQHVVVVTHGAILRQLLAACFEPNEAPWALSYANTVSHRVNVTRAGWSYDREL
jgi:broad specificity phosphatase PhoE